MTLTQYRGAVDAGDDARASDLWAGLPENARDIIRKEVNAGSLRFLGHEFDEASCRDMFRRFYPREVQVIYNRAHADGNEGLCREIMTIVKEHQVLEGKATAAFKAGRWRECYGYVVDYWLAVYEATMEAVNKDMEKAHAEIR